MSEKNLIPEDLDPRDATVRISMIMDGVLLLDLKRRAAENHLPYQTYMKMVLRNALVEMDRVSAMAARQEAQSATTSTSGMRAKSRARLSKKKKRAKRA